MADIQVFAMHNESPTSARTAEPGESIDFYDIVVREDAEDETGEIPILEEYDDLTLEQASKLADQLEEKYDDCAEWVGG
jgi:hypothetical protein